jgi:hypothetical protein
LVVWRLLNDSDPCWKLVSIPLSSLGFVAVQVMAKASSIDPQWKIVPYKTFAEARRARTKATKEDS